MEVKEGRGEEFCDIYATLEITYSITFIKNPETDLNSMYKIKNIIKLVKIWNSFILKLSNSF